MSGRRRGARTNVARPILRILDAKDNPRIRHVGVLLALFCFLAPFVATAQERREREPNSVYAARRAKLAAQVDAPIALWGFTGREEASQTYIFEQEENFYYLTGHNEEGAALVILPAAKAAGENGDGPRESLYLPVKNPLKEKWNGARMSPADPGIEVRTGFASVKPFAELRATVEGQAKLKDIRVQIGAMRQIKAPGEIAFLKQAIELSLDSQLAGMRMMRPGL